MIADEIKNKILSHIEEHFSEEEVSIASSKLSAEWMYFTRKAFGRHSFTAILIEFFIKRRRLSILGIIL